MIAYIKGNIEIKKQDHVVIDVNGIGYKVFMPETSLQLLEIGKVSRVFTYMRVREDDVSLYGFMTNEELTMFELLISVGGIGAKSAISILSNITPSKFALAVITNDVNSLKKLPGIGAKTAQRIILELKDKIKSEDAINSDAISETKHVSDNDKDAIEALQVLGYVKKDIENAISKIDTSDLSLEDIIKQGLKYLSR